MQRRELLKLIAVLTGGSVVGADLFLSGCKSKTTGIFTDGDIAFFDEVAETIIPRTDTPGAKDAATGKFIALYAADCYDEVNQKILLDGISRLNEASTKKYGRDFLKINAAQKQELLTAIDHEAKEYAKVSSEGKAEKPPHYFTLMKQLALLGFFTSKPGVTQALRYNPVPGKYEGCIDYKKGEAAWTW
jgi:hypothetical protein